MNVPSVANESELVERYGGLVRRLAGAVSKRCHRRVDAEDLESDGMIGLLMAARSFDPAKGRNFATYAGHRIVGAMMDSVRAMDWVPRLCRTRARKGQAERDAHYKATGEKIPQAVKVPLTNYNKSRSDPSDWSDSTWMLPGPPEHKPDPATNPYANAERNDAIRALLRGFDRGEQIVLSSIYDGTKLWECGRAVGISESRASQIRGECIERLRARLVPGYNTTDEAGLTP